MLKHVTSGIQNQHTVAQHPSVQNACEFYAKGQQRTLQSKARLYRPRQKPFVKTGGSEQ